ncbi:putative aldouronate transport system permease protein [Paenibacillus sp. UNCCL117]|uniref:ABC transporter permease n=1 Tax=unclassified Paenibacillus TaxID=185978 RepID=UPI000884FEF2|nr:MULTISPECIES: ABC transporter permease subunit [unclassified Paenibacillus]SDC76925.1 putative aldouronate transport system permease protein [Paenibacillus sp. cl123]SFW25715.1 putative aldouronate transport system permease protein [Paenibacillus sp. UNCCL117]
MVRSHRFNRFNQLWPFFLLATPGILYFLIFHYVPMWGLVLAFKDYSPFIGMIKSPWVGFEHFQQFFSTDNFYILLKNTLMISFLSLVVYFPFTILLSIMLNELRLKIFKRISQTVVYLPHFLSWVVIYGITISFFGPSGVINHYLEQWFNTNALFLVSNDWFRPLIVFQAIWKDAGWGTIIFLAALAGINPELYEAAKVDGANRFHNIWHITLPGIKSTIIILLLLRLGSSLDSNFMQIFLMTNSLNLDVSNVFDLFVYQTGLQQFNYSFAITVGMFKSVVSLILVLGANYLAKLMGEDGIF